MWDAQGRLKIVDRVKNIFKLAQGEYIAPEKIEVVYNKHELIAQSFVYGDSLKGCLVAIIVPDWDTAKGWAAQSGFTVQSISELCDNVEIKNALLKILTTHGKTNGLKGFENVKGIHLVSEMFTPENGLLSPTFKLKVMLRFIFRGLKLSFFIRPNWMQCMHKLRIEMCVGVPSRCY
jgi:long-chain acyl-CoA synthetase